MNTEKPYEQIKFESAKSYCGNCWQLVSNSVYFGKRGKSVHIDGRCKKRHVIPTSIYERTTSSRALFSFRSSSREAEDANRAAGYPKGHWSKPNKETIKQRIKTLQWENACLRQLLGVKKAA
jgi:hypothetical protein